MQNSKNLDLRWISRRFFLPYQHVYLANYGKVENYRLLETKCKSLVYITLANATAITFWNFTLNTKLYHSFYTET